MKILLIEDDLQLGKAVSRALEQSGFEICWVRMIKDALAQLASASFAVVLLDLCLPDGSGLSCLQQLRAGGDTTPVLVLTARDALEDKVAGLDAGADDYVVKPFAVPELVSRIRALVRRSAGFISPRVKAGDYELDLSRKELTIAGEVTVLTSFEYLILEYLMRNARQVVSKQQLLDQLYGDGEGDPNTIEVMVSRLRKKLDPEGSIQPISTIRRQGYIFNLACS